MPTNGIPRGTGNRAGVPRRIFPSPLPNAHAHAEKYGWLARLEEGASNCVERHLNLNDCDTSLLWTYSQVGHKCCFHSQRITPHASRLRYTARRMQAYVRVYARGDSKLRFTFTAMEQEREGEIERLRKRQAMTPHRPAKRSRRSCHVGTPSVCTALEVQVRQSVGVLWLVAIRLVACTNKQHLRRDRTGYSPLENMSI